MMPKKVTRDPSAPTSAACEKHGHRWKPHSATKKEIVEKCSRRCGASRARPLTRLERKAWNSSLNLNKPPKIHVLWWKYQNRAKSVSGVARMDLAERMAKRHPDRFMVAKVDDDYSMGARLLFHTHVGERGPSVFDPTRDAEPLWHGVSVELLTQGGGEKPPYFFLYPEHLDAVIDTLVSIRKEMNTFPHIRRDKRFQRSLRRSIDEG